MRSWYRRHGHLIWFLLPGVLLYGIFMAYPLVSSLGYSLFEWNGFVRGMFFGQHLTNWSLVFGGMVLASLPLLIVYLLMSRQFIAGLTAGAVKG